MLVTVPRAGASPSPNGAPAIAVASSLRAVWPALEARWRETLPDVTSRPTFGASRTLARQIARGAPFELFLAADERSVDDMPAAYRAAGTEAVYARGRLALVLRERADGVPTAGGSGADAATAPPATALSATASSATTPASSPTGAAANVRATPAGSSLAPLAERLALDLAFRLAIPNPSHAPYGRAAREALEAASLWPLEPRRLVVGENASQTLQFLLAGAADAALVPQSLVADGAPAGTRTTLVDAHLHAPLVHRLVATANASPAALSLAAWFGSAAARETLAQGGFDTAGE